MRSLFHAFCSAAGAMRNPLVPCWAESLLERVAFGWCQSALQNTGEVHRSVLQFAKKTLHKTCSLTSLRVIMPACCCINILLKSLNLTRWYRLSTGLQLCRSDGILGIIKPALGSWCTQLVNKPASNAPSDALTRIQGRDVRFTAQ